MTVPVVFVETPLGRRVWRPVLASVLLERLRLEERGVESQESEGYWRC